MKKIRLLFVSLMLIFTSGMIVAQNISVSGTVTDGNGNPVEFAYVQVKGTNQVATTDALGRFTIQALQNGTLVASSVGYTTTEVPVNGRAIVNITLEEDVQALEGSVVIGYGTAKKVGNVVGSVVQVSAEKIKDRPVANVVDALQGKVAGLQIYTSSGEPDATASMRLHGVGSFGASNTPLYVIDGVPVSAGAIRSFNPNDFESITVLKDASATSIYGSRAANGVVYITMRKGATNRPASISFNANYGVSNLANDDFFQIMNSSQLKEFWLDLGRESVAAIEGYFENGVDTKWSDVYYKSNVPTHQVNLSITGGSGKTTYYVSGSNFRQEGTTPRSSFERNTLFANIESGVNDWLRVGLSTTGSYAKRENNAYTYQGSNNLNGGLFWLAEPYVDPYDEDGKVLDRIPGLFGSTASSPEYLARMMPNYADDYRASLKGWLQINPIKGLTFRTLGGLDGLLVAGSSHRYPTYIPNYGNGTTSYSHQLLITRMISNTLEYKFDINKEHFVTVLVGQEANDADNKYFTASAQGLLVDHAIKLQDGNPELTTASSSSYSYLYSSFFGRAEYSYGDKYFFDASLRNDASSRFGSGKTNATFYSVGGVWNMKSENFLKDVRAISQMKLKVSYGTQGNSEIGNYEHQAYTTKTTNYQEGAAYIYGRQSNPLLSWETAKKLTIAFDAEFFNKLRVNLEYYDRTTANMLMSVPYPYTTGIGSRTENTASIKNYGFDFTLDYDILKHRDYFLNFTAIFNYNFSKVTELFDGKKVWTVPNTGVTYVVGKPVEFYYPIFKEVDPEDGRQVWYLPGDDFTVTQKDDTKTTKSFNSAVLEQSTGLPRYAPMSGGFTLSGGWKGISISAHFSYALKKYLISNDRYFAENPYNFYGYNQSYRVTDYWKQQGDVKDYPDWKKGQIMQFDTHLLEDASYMRLKDLTIGYTLPQSVLNKTGFIKGFRVYGTGRNLFTLTNYLGPDPEIDSNLTYGAYPNSKQFTLGLEITF